jgi:hypothetical protein
MKNSFRDGTLRPAITSFFNEEIDASRAFLKSHLETAPEDPLAYAIAAAVEFYGTVIGWMLAGGEISAASLLRGRHMEMRDEQRDAMIESLRLAEGFAEQARVDDDLSDMGIFALSVVSGVRRDFDCLVLQSWKSSLAHAQDANLLGRKMLKANPRAHDAYCIFAWSEYLIQRVPAAVRPFARIPGITGDRVKAIQFCEVASRTGCYYREFALCLLVALYTEEGNHAAATRILSDLAGQFPKSSTIASELKRRQGFTEG